MKLDKLIKWVLDKSKFNSLNDYSIFCEAYLSFIFDGLQAVIVSRNENHYRFFQYKDDGNYNVTRPINSNLFISLDEITTAKKSFINSLDNIRSIRNNIEQRQIINKFIYTCQQSIGATLDALPTGKSNFARKINGDLFERYIRLILIKIGVPAKSGTVKVPIIVDNKKLFDMSYQHDIIIERDNSTIAIGSVKTTSKDRIDKIFIDKFLFNKLTNMDTPHFAIFLNDVQRKGKENNYGINATFLTGHFKGYTIKLNPLDGVYYCDIRPNMLSDSILKDNIKTLDYLLVDHIWQF